MKDQTKTWLVSFFLLGWTGFVLWHFFHSFPLVNLPEILGNGFMLALLHLFFIALGRRVLRVFSITFTSFAEEASFSFGLGTGITIFLVIALATLQLLHELVVVCLILLLFVLLYSETKTLCLDGYQAVLSLSLRKRPIIELVFLGLIGLAGLVTFFAAATPPFFFDALVYHLAVPQQYLLQHGFHYMPYHHFSNFPMNVGMLFIVGMSFSGGMLAKLISWSFAPMTAFAVYGFAKSRWGTSTAIMAAAILFLVPGVLILSMLTSVDLAVMFYSFLSFSSLLVWFRSRQKSWFILAGLFCGIAIGTKYTALITTFAAILIILFFHELLSRKQDRILFSIRTPLFLAGIALCFMLPWLLKNIIYTGNPVYPLLNSLLGTHITHQYTNYDQYLSQETHPYSLITSFFKNGAMEAWGSTLINYLKSPWTITMQTTRAAGKTGVIFLLCLLPGIFLKKINSPIRSLLALGGSSFGLWIILLPNAALRYVFQMFPPFSLASAYVLYSLPISSFKKNWILGSITLLLVSQFTFFFQEAGTLQPYTYLLQNLSKDQFLLGHGVNYYPLSAYINSELPYTAKILYVGELRSYYCERNLLLATDAQRVDEAILLRQFILDSQNAEQVLQKLGESGITHILINRSEMKRFTQTRLDRDSYFDFHTKKDEKIFQELFEKYLNRLISEYQVELYQILYP